MKPKRLAFDWPTGLPQGFNLGCCSAPQLSCNCAVTDTSQNGPKNFRLAEHEGTAAGIRLDYTNKNSPPYWKQLVTLMWPLWSQLSARSFTLGQNAIETYPYGVHRRLLCELAVLVVRRGEK
jgi:hypothetical protein